LCYNPDRYGSICVARSGWKRGEFFLFNWGGGVRVLDLCLCFRVQAINFILNLGNVDRSVAVMLRGSSIQQCHSTNWT